MKVVHRLLLVALAWWLQQGGAQPVAGDCARACGNMSVPYPFGLKPKCASSEEFSLHCDTSGSREQLLLGHYPIRNISVQDSTMVISLPPISACYDKDGRQTNRGDNLFIDLSLYPHYRLSHTQNELTVRGCDTYVLITDQNGIFRTACFTNCSTHPDFDKQATCSGFGCCQAPIPEGLKTLRINISSINGWGLVSQLNTCAKAFVAEKVDRTPPSFNDLGADLVLDWMVPSDVICGQAKLNQSSYACGNNTECEDFENGPGYRCFCKLGCLGNPYDRFKGCQDIDECKDPETYPCLGKCKNTLGNYTCQCGFGLQGSAKLGGCYISQWVKVVSGLTYALGIIIIPYLVGVIPSNTSSEP